MCNCNRKIISYALVKGVKNIMQFIGHGFVPFGDPKFTNSEDDLMQVMIRYETPAEAEVKEVKPKVSK